VNLWVGLVSFTVTHAASTSARPVINLEEGEEEEVVVVVVEKKEKK